MSSSPTSLSSSEPAAEAAAQPPLYSALGDVTCIVDVYLGTGRITVRDCLKLQHYSVIRLEQSSGTDLDVRVQGVTVAVGEAVVIEESMAVRLTAIASPSGTGTRGL
jgi:flagellar motor switch protein FliN